MIIDFFNIAAVLGIIYLAYNDKEGWGWLIVVLLCTGRSSPVPVGENENIKSEQIVQIEERIDNIERLVNQKTVVNTITTDMADKEAFNGKEKKW